MLLGMDQHWSSARRLSNEDGLIPMLVRYDLTATDPATVGGLFKYVHSPVLDAKRMPNKESVTLCSWVHTAVHCIQLLKQLADNRGLLEKLNARLDEQTRAYLRLTEELRCMTER